jgi:hypothetical protein
MSVLRAFLVGLALAPLAAPAQQVFKCVGANGAVTYQETPCATQSAQKRVDTSHGAAADPVAREMLEREAYRGDPLAGRFVEEARERERRERLERLESEERARRKWAEQPREAEEPPAWDTPWGWPGPPGLARPRPKPTPAS